MPTARDVTRPAQPTVDGMKPLMYQGFYHPVWLLLGLSHPIDTRGARCKLAPVYRYTCIPQGMQVSVEYCDCGSQHSTAYVYPNRTWWRMMVNQHPLSRYWLG